MKRSDISIKSDRLWLRQIDETDAETIVSLRSNPEVYKYFVSPHRITMEEHKSWYKKVYLEDDNRITWIARDQIGTIVGIFGAVRESKISKLAEINYILDPEEQGKGYAREATLRVIRFCKENWNTEEVIAIIHKNNYKSLLFVEKMGFNQKEVREEFLIYGLHI